MPDAVNIPEIPENLVRVSEYSSDIDDFCCGIDDLDEFIKEEAVEYSERNLGETWLLLNDDTVAAFYTLAPTSLSNDCYTGDESPAFEDLDDFPYPVPSLLIARLGVTDEYQRNGIGERLVAYIHVWAERQAIPFWLIQVDSKENSVEFYEETGFVTSGEDSGNGTTQMFSPIGSKND